MTRSATVAFCCYLLVWICCGGSAEERPPASKSRAVFERRILPIFRSDKPSSCAECHLSGVDLKDYIRADEAETLTLLIQAGLVDPQQPDKSKLLEFIRRKPERPSLVSAEVRKEELAAFADWIRAAAADPKLRQAKIDPKNKTIGPKLPGEVIRHTRKDQLLASFREQVWSEINRCAACHSPKLNQKQVEKHGERVSWIVPDDPAATLQKLLDAGNIDLDEPKSSPILMKPTMQTEHGGGVKMTVGDRTYRQFHEFIVDYAAAVNNRYQSADELPAPPSEVRRAAEAWLKLADVPEKYDRQLMQIDLYRQENGGWSKDRWATSERQVFGKGKLWQHNLTLTAPRDSQRANEIRKAQKLPPGTYLLRIYVDGHERLKRDYPTELDQREFVAEIRVDSQWPDGYQAMTVVAFPKK
jgi:hypothetical protein